MTETGSGKKSIVQLILMPSLITLAVTILRLEGELQHFRTPWFSSSAGGGGAIIGISWLPIIFGPYFALKLAGSDEGTSSYGKAFGMTVLVWARTASLERARRDGYAVAESKRAFLESCDVISLHMRLVPGNAWHRHQR